LVERDPSKVDVAGSRPVSRSTSPLQDRGVRVAILTAVIAVAASVGIVVWLVRYQPFGAPAAQGTPLPSEAPEAAGWSLVGDAPAPRLEMATAVLDERIWLAGGLAPDGSVLDIVSAYDPTDGRWADAPALAVPVHHAAMASDGERLLLVGGYASPSGAPTPDAWVLARGATAWEPGPVLPEPRAAGAITFDGSRFVYAGGVGPGGVRSDVFVLDGDAWRRIGDLARPREHLAATTDGAGRAWFMGGRQGGADRNLGDVEVVTGEAIDLVASITARGGVAAFFVDGIGACLSGGEAPSFAFAIVECVEADGRVTALPEMTQPRHGHGAAVVGSSAYALLGGELPGLHASSSVEVLALGEADE
jgi:hypothetical protein